MVMSKLIDPDLVGILHAARVLCLTMYMYCESKPFGLTCQCIFMLDSQFGHISKGQQKG